MKSEKWGNGNEQSERAAGPQAQATQNVTEVQGILIPPAAAGRILAAMRDAQAAQARSNEIANAVAAALGAPDGSSLAQVQGDGALYFIPPRAAAQPHAAEADEAAGVAVAETED